MLSFVKMLIFIWCVIAVQSLLATTINEQRENEKASFTRRLNALRRQTVEARSTGGCDERGHTDLGNMFATLQGRAHDAAVQYATAIACNPRSATPQINLGVLHSRAGEDKLALTQLDRSLRLEPHGEWAHLAWQGIGIIRTRQGRIREALDSFRAALRLAPRDPGSYKSIAQALRASRRPELALKYAMKALQFDPRDLESNIELGQALLDARRADDAVRVWEAGLKAGIEVASQLAVARGRSREADLGQRRQWPKLEMVPPMLEVTTGTLGSSHQTEACEVLNSNPNPNPNPNTNTNPDTNVIGYDLKSDYLSPKSAPVESASSTMPPR